MGVEEVLAVLLVAVEGFRIVPVKAPPGAEFEAMGPDKSTASLVFESLI